MKEFVLDYLDQACTSSEQIVSCQQNAGGADLLVKLSNGKRVAIYVFNRALRLPEIQEKYERNTARKLHTLFLVDGRMMPGDGTRVEPPHWMAALHALGHGQIYAYWADRRDITIRPVHLEWRWGGQPRHVEYGPAIDFQTLRTGHVEVASSYINGYFTMADFGDTGFWKKRDPGEGKQHKYSWREWSYAGKRKTRVEEPEGGPAGWDSWEEFQRQYGEVGGDYTRQRYANSGRRQRDQQTARPIYRVEKRDYALLGVNEAASYDEVKQAYRRKARENHPDLHPPQDKDKYNARMATINAAFERLSKLYEVK